jgi:hypothetical protein
MAGGGMKALQLTGSNCTISLADVNGVSGTVRPGRGGARVKTGLDQKIKKPADGARKKAPPARKAPTRGRYVDEYANPVI